MFGQVTIGKQIIADLKQTDILLTWILWTEFWPIDIWLMAAILVSKYIEERNLSIRHLAERHLADRHWTGRHCTQSLFDWLSIWPTVNWSESLFINFASQPNVCRQNAFRWKDVEHTPFQFTLEGELFNGERKTFKSQSLIFFRITDVKTTLEQMIYHYQGPML